MPWWTKVDAGALAGVQEHKTRLQAGITIRFAVMCGGASPELCGIYKKDPRKHPDAENHLPRIAAKADRAASRRNKGGL